MLNVGVHFGKYAIYICQYYPGRRGGIPRFDDRRRTNYGLETWYSIYQGLFPNAYHAVDGVVEYDALDRVGLQAMPFNGAFFHKMLGLDDEAATATHIWEKLQSSLRRNYLSETGEPAAVAFHLEQIDFTVATNRFVPWKRDDLTGKFLDRATELGRQQHGFVNHMSVYEDNVIRAVSSTIPNLAEKSLLIEVGGYRTTIWEIRNGVPHAYDQIDGLDALNLSLPLQQHKVEKFKQLTSLLFASVRPPLKETDWLNDWVDNKLSCPLQKLIKRSTSCSHVYVFGEGVQLLQTLANQVTIPVDILYVSARARGAAMLCYQHQSKQGV